VNMSNIPIEEAKVKPLTPKQYEAYVGELVRKLDFAKTGKVELNRRFKGVRQPGAYEIDVALEVQLAEAIRFLLIVECKNWKRPVDRPVVQKLAQTRDAIGADKAAIVSPVGFTDEACSVARSLEVALWIIRLGEWVTVYPGSRMEFDWQAVR
jgi:Restriction endonuclease